MVALDWQSMAKGWRRFWSSKLVKQLDVKGRHFRFSFMIYRSDDGEQTCRIGVRNISDSFTFSIRPDELERLVEAAQEVRAQFRA
jgi:hypothetical protein